MRIRIDEYPQLKLLAWSMPGADELEAGEALALYERNWHLVDEAAITLEERALIDRLVAEHGRGVLLV